MSDKGKDQNIVTVTVSVLSEPKLTKPTFDSMLDLHQAYLRAEAAGYADEFMMLEQEHYDRTRSYRSAEQRALDSTTLRRGPPN